MTSQTHSAFVQTLQKNYGWTIALSILMTVLGLIALARPIHATIAIPFVLGWIFIFSAIFQLIYSFMTKGAGPFILKLLLSILYFIAGGFLLYRPISGIFSLTLIVGIFFFVEGIFRIVHAIQIRGEENWGWVLFHGITTLILGIVIWSQWPFNTPWLIGLLAGIILFVNGLSTLMLSLAARRSVAI